MYVDPAKDLKKKWNIIKAMPPNMPVPFKAVGLLLELKRQFMNILMVVVGLLCCYFAISQNAPGLFVFAMLAFLYPFSSEARRTLIDH